MESTLTQRIYLGTGGYVSVPVMYAAYLLRIPTVTLEPNRKPGMANATGDHAAEYADWLQSLEGT